MLVADALMSQGIAQGGGVWTNQALNVTNSTIAIMMTIVYQPNQTVYSITWVTGA